MNRETVTEILPGLWLGGGRASLKQFDAVVTCWQKAEPAPKHVLELRYPFADGHSARCFDEDQLSSVVSWATDQWWARNKQVLVRCQMGVNRSALVVGLVLCDIGMRSERAVKLMREKRGPRVLHNTTFEQYLLER